MAFDHRGRHIYTEKQYLALCRGINWSYEGTRELCNGKAEHYIGDIAYGQAYRLGFCGAHWRGLKLAIERDITLAGDELGHWIVEQVMSRHRDTFDELRVTFLRERLRAAEAAIERIRAQDRSPAYIYFVQSGDDGPIKIGTAKNVFARLANLQVGSPYTLNLRAHTPGGIALERAYHEQFTRHRMGGEWFEPAPALLAAIEAINAAALIPASPQP